MISPPVITSAAREHLAGRPVVVRTSVRHGCCGGQASLAVAEVGPPTRATGFRTVEVDGVTVHLDERLDRAEDAWDGPWTIAVDGFLRLRRLVVLDGVHRN